MSGEYEKSRIRQAALEYWKLGAVIIPYSIRKNEKTLEWDKKPSVEWKRWQTTPQSEQEFQNLPFDDDVNAFGVLTGTMLSNGFYFCAVDFDVKKVSASAVEKGKALLTKFRTTKRESTVSNGEHLIYYSKVKPSNVNMFHDVCGLELIAEHRAVIMAPSFGYKTINDNLIGEVQDVEQMFLKVIGDAGFRKRQVKRKGKIRYCCQVALERDNHIKHEMRLCIAAEFKKACWGENDIADLFKTQLDYDREKTLYQVRTADPKKALTKQTISELGYCYKDCPSPCDKTETEEKYVQKPTVITEDFIAEEIWDRRGFPQYYVHYFDGKEDEVKESLDVGETDIHGNPIIYVPVDNTALRKGLVILPTGVKPCTWKELLDKIDTFAPKCYDACGQDVTVKFLCRVVIGSWFLDRFVEDPEFDVAGAGKFAPLIPIRGPSKSGKNRLAFVLRLLSYRPYFEMSTYRIPSLYRPLDLWQGTLVLDEADFNNTNEKSELVHFLNCRATGSPLSRQNPKNPRITDVFTNFGLTILTQRRLFDDNATENRSLPYYSEQTDQKIPTVETDTMLKEGLELQNMLLYLRLKYFKEVKIDKTAWLQEISDPRLVAALLPLLALAKLEPSLMETVKETVKGMERLKVEQTANSEDGIVINTLWDKEGFACYAAMKGHEHYYFTHQVKTKIAEDKDEIQTLPLTVSMLAEELRIKGRDIRKILNSLNLSVGMPRIVKLSNKNWRVIWFDPARLEKRLREFVVDYEPNSLYEKLGLKKLATDATHATDKTGHKNISDYSNSEASEQKTKSEASPKRSKCSERSQKEPCPLCLQPLPDDLTDTTVYQGETVHTVCYLRMRDREAQPHD
jgi:hypothetical protein